MNELTAICPECDNIIPVENGAKIGDFVSCQDCFWEGEINSIDIDGNVWFREEEMEEQE